MVAPLAQSVEHSHGKAGVAGSIPARGSLERAWRDSSVGQSARLIIVRSRVRVPVPLQPSVNRPRFGITKVLLIPGPRHR
ncbi:uncharacterized protein METZ01_LOCUS42270 [marine metagenome]|uniref:Uncharacterized protein n=1 Tax=marine metagenome TaxID=408172 RepID=A0A381RCB3_9ZZZZ